MDKLPCELYQMIFEHLDLSDVINFKRVSKKFYRFIKHEYQVKELILSDNLEKGVWLFDKKLCNFKNRIPYFKPKKSIIKCLFDKLFNLDEFFSFSEVPNSLVSFIRIKRLKIKHPWNENFVIDLKQVNIFDRLEQLEIEIGSVVSGKLQLRNLKCLSFTHINRIPNIIIETPNLKTLHLDNISEVDNSITFVYPNSVEHLCVAMYHEQIQFFKNLKTLEVQTSSNLNLDVLKAFTKLEKLLTHDQDNKNFHLNNFLRYRKLGPKNSQPKIFYKSLLLNSNQSLDNFKMNELKSKYSTMITYKSDDKSTFEINSNFIAFRKLMKFLPFETIEKNFGKFKSIELILVNKGLDYLQQNQLLKFISNCPSLNCFSVCKSNLSQNFLNQLPSVSSIKKLVIEESELKYSFSFILKMFYLVELEVDQNVNICEIDLNKLKHLRKLSYQANQLKKAIEKLRNDKYNLTCSKIKEIEYEHKKVKNLKYNDLKSLLKCDSKELTCMCRKIEYQNLCNRSVSFLFSIVLVLFLLYLPLLLLSSDLLK